MASNISGEIEMKLDKANATIRSQADELKKLRGEMKSTQVEAKKTGESMVKSGDSLNKHARRARSDLAVFGAQGRVIGQFAQGFTSLAGPVGLIGAAVMGVGVAWSAVSSEIEEAKKRAEEFKKSMDKLDEGAVKESGLRATEAQKSAESNIGLGLVYRDPEEYKREAQRKYGFTQEQAGGVLGAVMPAAKKIPKENREIFLRSIMDAVQVAQIGAGMDPVVAAKALASNPSAMMQARLGKRYDAGAKVASGAFGFRVTSDQIEENVNRQLKKPDLLDKMRAIQLETPKDPIATEFDRKRKKIEDDRKFLEKSIRGGDKAAEFLENQQKERRDMKVPFMKSMLGFDERSYATILEQSQSEERAKLAERIKAQNPDLEQKQVNVTIEALIETIRLNTLSNTELKKELEKNSAKTKENTGAANAAAGTGRE